MRIKKSTVILHLIAWLSALLWLIPLLGSFMASVRPYREILHGWWDFTEFNPSLDNFAEAMFYSDFPLARGILNSLLVAVPATIIPILVASLAGYGFARFSFPMKTYLFVALVLLMSVPQQMIAVPIYRILLSMGLIDTFLGLILVHAAWGLPWIILFMRNYFSTLPIEIEEAARVDGASDFKIFRKIVIPMTLPAFASAAVLQFMWVWNDFFLALLIIGSSDNYLAVQRLPYMKGLYHYDHSLLAAGSMIVTIIPMILFIVLQKYYIKGMIGWTVKG
ncbi:ABC transporter permease subunit [Candidatus Bathyarchaeota archaeon]|nr:ABC transporter permease subunit [Candidatus Bathyarchaeota archaeon]